MSINIQCQEQYQKLLFCLNVQAAAQRERDLRSEAVRLTFRAGPDGRRKPLEDMAHELGVPPRRAEALLKVCPCVWQAAWKGGGLRNGEERHAAAAC
eukprot:363607-Chlamydomonas_euryale.AAC.4